MAPRASRYRAVVYGRNLRTELGRQGIAVRELARRLEPRAEKLDMVRANLYRYLRGKTMPSESTRTAIAEALDRTPEQIYNEDDEEEAAQSVQVERGLAVLEDLMAAVVYVREHGGALPEGTGPNQSSSDADDGSRAAVPTPVPSESASHEGAR